MRETLRDYCARTGREELLEQWDERRNIGLSPATVTYGSKHSVWWRCEKGHTWQAAVYCRSTGGSRCPYCAGKRPWPGENDLASRYPELAAQWHPEKNGDLTPADVTVGSHRSVWWRCERGHEWRAIVKTRTAGCGCPVCSNKLRVPGINDLASTHPQLAAEWDQEKNRGLTPSGVTAGSARKAWWRCGLGHSWYASVNSRVRGNGCPVCAGKAVLEGFNDLASQYPEVAAQWHPMKNGDLRPDAVTSSSNQRVWWRCELGHEWPALVASRTSRGSGCPYCAGRKVLAGFNDLATLEPELAKQWHPTLNGAMTPSGVTAGSSKMAWWQCQLGHVWKAVISSRSTGRKCGCPVCAGRTGQRESSRRRMEYAMALAAQKRAMEERGAVKDGAGGSQPRLMKGFP